MQMRGLDLKNGVTAINKQISGNDKGITGAIQHLTTTTNNIKTSVDQKACQIMNKTSAVLDKVKTTQIDFSKQIQDTTHEISKLSEYKRQVPPMQNSTMDLSQQKTAGASEHRKQHSNKNENGQNKQNPTPLLRIVQIFTSEAASTVRTKLVSRFTQVF